MRKNIDDIDDDAPPTRAPSNPSTSASAPPSHGRTSSTLDDLFGEFGTTVIQKPTPPPQATISPPKPSTPSTLDHFFDAPPAKTSPNVWSLETGASLRTDNDLLDFSGGVRTKQHARNENEFLNGFVKDAKGIKDSSQGATLGDMVGNMKPFVPPPHIMQIMNYFDLLGVTRTASTDEIKRSYKAKALHFHPDKNPNQPPNEREYYKALTFAQEVLCDTQKRREYEVELLANDQKAKMQSNWLSHVAN